MGGRRAVVLAIGFCIGCHRPPEPVVGPTRSVSAEAREALLARARVWMPPLVPIEQADLGANPPGDAALGRVVECRFVLQASPGHTPKFHCRLPGGDVVKVKYGRNNAEVFAEVAATRLLAALGFPTDRMHVVDAVRCDGCPAYPYARWGWLDRLLMRPGRVTVFDWAVVERRFPGRDVEGPEGNGWSWAELDRIDPARGGSSRAEVDALRLMAAFLAHWDNKASNQRLVCTGSAPGCPAPVALVHDLGKSFGPFHLDVDAWRRRPVWADGSTCRLSMEDLPYGGATFGDRLIGEAGRAFLAERLGRLGAGQIERLFEGARVTEFSGNGEHGRRVADWVEAFHHRARQIVDRPPCPP